MKIMYFKVLFLCLALLPLGVSAQTTLRGIIKDNTGVLIGATVSILNSDNRVIGGNVTNQNGEYTVPIPNMKDLKIEFSYVGYTSQRVVYKGQTVLNATLEETATNLDEVTVSAKAIERNNMGISTKDLGIAQQKIDLEEYQDMPVTSVEDMLQGKMANVDIVASSGNPGAKSSIRIRGTSSLNASNEPLIVIDDIPYETEINEDFDFATATDEDMGALVNIAPSDIASITVLKDAAATAIYGSKAANGVLLITTKKGVKGKPRFSVTQRFNINKEPKGIPMLNAEQYVTLLQDGIWNQVRDREFTHEGDVSKFLEQYPDIRFDPTYQWFNEFSQDTDWLGMVTQNAFVSETNFSMSGGGDRATYRFSAGYLSEGGTTIGTGLQRITTRLNVDYNFSKKLRVSAAFSYAESNRDANYRDDVRSHARNKMPNMSAYVIDENGNMTDEYFTNPTTNVCIQGTWKDQKQFNPVAMAKESINNLIDRTMRVSFNLRYNILSSLLFTEDIAFDLGSSKSKKFLPNSAIGVSWTSGDYNNGADNMSDDITVSTNTKLIYTPKIGEDHKMIFTAMAQTRDYNYSSYASSMSGFGSAEVADPTAGGKITALNSGNSQNRSIGALLNGHYNFRDRYMVTAGIRFDGNSKMGKNSRWGSFPSLQAVWRLSNESFLVEKEWLDELKIRASWGKSGTSPSGNYTYIGKFTSNGNYMDLPAIKPSSIQLNNLKWETVTQYNVGVDVNLFKGKVGVVMEYYQKTTDDLLQTNVPIQSTAGFGNIGYFNSGKVENKGWEIMIDLRDIVKIGDFKFGITNLNLSRNRNRVKELPSNMKYEKYDFNNGNYAQNVVVGNPVGSFYGYKYNGVYQNYDQTLARDRNGDVIQNIYGEKVITTVKDIEMKPGDANYADINHDGIIDKYDIVYLGNSMPILTGGGSLNFNYKGVRLRASFQTRIGQSVINKARMNSENMRGTNNQSTSVLKRWRYEGDDTDIPRALYGWGYNYLGSDRFVEKASFLRLKDLMLSYTFDKKAMQKLGIQNLSCYITTYDVFTWTNYKGQDPEVSIGGSKGIYQLAEDKSMTPRPFRMALGLTIDF